MVVTDPTPPKGWVIGVDALCPACAQLRPQPPVWFRWVGLGLEAVAAAAGLLVARMAYPEEPALVVLASAVALLNGCLIYQQIRPRH